MLAPQSTNARLQAAQGYLGLGLPQDAWGELESIDAKHRGHPRVLKVRLEVARALGQWEIVAELARHLLNIEPDDPLHALNLAQAMRQREGPAAKTALP
jgi:predicted Zn-dependent protease